MARVALQSSLRVLDQIVATICKSSRAPYTPPPPPPLPSPPQMADILEPIFALILEPIFVSGLRVLVGRWAEDTKSEEDTAV